MDAPIFSTVIAVITTLGALVAVAFLGADAVWAQRAAQSYLLQYVVAMAAPFVWMRLLGATRSSGGVFAIMSDAAAVFAVALYALVCLVVLATVTAAAAIMPHPGTVNIVSVCTIAALGFIVAKARS